MILFFPQYQAGYVPSRIPVGTPELRALWQNAPGFVEVPLHPTNIHDTEEERRIKYRHVLREQLFIAAQLIGWHQPDFILTTGGDCGTAVAPIAYLNEKYQGKIGLLWIDAHGDIHAPSTSPSHNFHGMPIRLLMDDPEFAVHVPLPLRAEQIAYLGLRDTQAEEDQLIAEKKIPRYLPQELKTNKPLDEILKRFRAAGITHLHLHVDTDVMDPAVWPHVHVPAPGGLTLERLIEILKYLRAKMPVAGCCLTEYAPAAPGAGLAVMKQLYSEGLGLRLP
jgi:arginase